MDNNINNIELPKMEEPSRLLVTDMDEVLVNITPKWTKLILSDIKDNTIDKKFFKYCYKPDDETLNNLIDTPELVLFRNNYNLYDLFTIKEEYSTKEMLPKVRKELNDLFLAYLEDEDFYMDIPPTPIAETLAVSTKTDNIGKIIILTHSYSEITDRSKVKYINKLFKKDHKVKLEPIRFNKSKVDYLNELDVECAVFIEDSPNTIKETIKKYNKDDMTILIPELGYLHDILRDLNDNDSELVNVAKENNVNIGTYSKFLNKDQVEKIKNQK